MKSKISKFDTGMIYMALVYLVLPMIIFLFGWTKLWIASLGSVLLLFLAWKVKEELQQDSKEIDLFSNSSKYWIITVGVILVWVFLSGIGGFCFQNSDFFVRNPIMRDLANYSWPVYYDLSLQSEFVQSLIGTDTVAFAYYFTYWLPVCLLSKLLGGSDPCNDLLLYAWVVLGLVIIVYFLNRYLKKNSYLVLAIFIFFSGLDVVVWFLEERKIPFNDHLEWWASYFQYSSNTTQLYWVFNQSVPIWLLIIMLLQLKKNTNSVGWSALAFAYSPFATMGMVPIALATVLGKKEKIRTAVSWNNIVIPLLMLVIYGTFYTANSGSLAYCGNIFSFNKGNEIRVFLFYLLFLIMEIGLYFLCMGKAAKKYPLYGVVLAELLFIPLYHMTAWNDFAMRVSIPALFILMIYVMRFFFDADATEKKKKILLVLLLIGAFTSLGEINRGYYNTLKYGNGRKESVYSFGQIRSEDQTEILTVHAQFFVHDYEETLFFKYLAK